MKPQWKIEKDLAEGHLHWRQAVVVLALLVLLAASFYWAEGVNDGRSGWCNPHTATDCYDGR